MSHLRVDTALSAEETSALWAVYAAVFADDTTVDAWRREVWDRHRVRPGFRVARAYAGQALVGFAYGYTGAAGQWWTDRARAVLPPDVAADWLGGHFELVSTGVVDGAQGRGVGRRLMRTLLAGLPHRRLLLMTTADPEDPARRLYAAEAWRVIGPGIAADQVIMGREAQT